MKKSLIALIILVAFSFASCSTLVRINTPDAEGAIVKVNGERIGTTPTKAKLSDAIWEDYEVEVTMDGYKPYHGMLKKEFKVGTFIGGFFIWPLFLWVYGPAPIQNIYLDKN